MRVDNLDANIDYFLTVATHLPGTLSPHVVLVERAGRDPMIVVARLEERRFPVKVGYRELVRPRLRSIVVAFDGILGAETPADLETCVEALGESLRGRGIDAVVLQKVAVDSPVFEAAARLGRRSRLRGLPSATRWLLDLPDSMEALLERRSAKARKETRYEERKLLRTYEDDVLVERLDLGPRDRLRADMEAVAQTTYQRALGVGGGESGLDDALTELGLDNGWLRVWMLYLRGVPVAFWKGTAQGHVFATDTPGYDPAYAKDRVGTYVMHAMLADLCADPAITVVDFGHGDAEYKRRYSTRSVEQQDVVLLARRPRPAMVGGFVSSTAAVNRLAYRLLGSTGFAARLRRRWRTRLSTSNPTPGSTTTPTSASAPTDE
ncbi:GNAT family N-acetyltransferase [Leifsonia sp. NPDC058230]|uniref:GNAT family N-acetyltransferase n=1 Tax=Leifsonia sp. NPDC058230 TaxID=3346391 RepID=UPI0036DF4DB9